MSSKPVLAAAVAAALFLWTGPPASAQQDGDQPQTSESRSETGNSTAESGSEGSSPDEKTASETSDDKPGAAPEESAGDDKDKSAADETQASGSAEKEEPAAKETETAAADGEKPDRLRVASWGGAYGESQKRAYFSPFEDATGIAIEAIAHRGDFSALTTLGGTGAPDWDLIDIDPAALEVACRKGTVIKVDASELADAEDGTPAREDFFDGMLHECGVPSVAWSSAIVYDERAFEKARPKTAGDFFDPKRFPGPRALPRDPKYVYELALMADGVAPDEVYGTLATDEGVARAQKRLDAIRDHIVWWKRAHEPLQLLEQQNAAMGLAFNGRAFNAIVAENRPFGMIWDGQVYDLDLWAIPAGSEKKQSALEFITFATRPGRLALQAGWFPYGPARKSAVRLVGRHPEVDVDMSAYIPTSEPNFKRALRLNAQWWSEHGAEMQQSFKVWLIGDGGSAESGLDFETEYAQP